MRRCADDLREWSRLPAQCGMTIQLKVQGVATVDPCLERPC
jgi:hypothetical protein